MPAFMAATEYVPKNQKIMEKEMKITAPEGCEIEKVEIVDGVAVVTFKKKERKLPKSWEEFCGMSPLPLMFATTKTDFDPFQDYLVPYRNRLVDAMSDFTTDRATAEAVLALCQLIQLRDYYNGDWVPDWENGKIKYFIEFCNKGIQKNEFYHRQSSPLYFKTEELRDEFLRNFRPLIEKLKPLYGIK
jgi:hypothetical protein